MQTHPECPEKSARFPHHHAAAAVSCFQKPLPPNPEPCAAECLPFHDYKPLPLNPEPCAAECLPFHDYDGHRHRGLFSLPKVIRKALAEETKVMTKDTPVFLT